MLMLMMMLLMLSIIMMVMLMMMNRSRLLSADAAGTNNCDGFYGYGGYDGNNDLMMMPVMKGCCRTEAADTNAGCLDPVA